MKFVISRLELSGLLGKIQNVVTKSPTLPILSNVLLEAANDEVVLSATDLTVSVRCYTDTKVLQEGAITLPLRRLSQLARELTSSELEITSSGPDLVEVVADSARFTLRGIAKDDFPAFPEFEGASRFTIKQPLLKKMFFSTFFATAKEDTRYAMTGVMVQIADGEATFVGTDGKRLSRTHTKLEIDPGFTGSYIIPTKAVEEIYKNLTDEEDETATVYLLEDRVAVEAGQMTLITKLVHGDYPDIDRVVPKQLDTLVTLHKEELASLLRQISLVLPDVRKPARFILSEGNLEIAAKSADVGQGQVSMPVNYQGPQVELAFNPAFYLDILRHCSGETITFGITDAYTPGIITDTEKPPAPEERPNPLFVLMPMRVVE